LLHHRNENLLDNRVVNLEWTTKEALKRFEELKSGENKAFEEINRDTVTSVNSIENMSEEKKERLAKSLEHLSAEDDELYAADAGKENYESPAYNVQRIPISKIRANDYNPNNVASPEMKLLYTSIYEDGYTMPIVCYYDEETDTYIIVDGFHRYQTMLDHKDIFNREKGCLPVAVIDKPIEGRIASTIRHNEARGKGDVQLMANIVASIHRLGRSDAWIAKHIGMSKDEILRLKTFSSMCELFQDKKNFSKADMKAHHIVMKNKRAHVVEDLIE
jgi:ParB-like chromosome segregation protein Spo0J